MIYNSVKIIPKRIYVRFRIKVVVFNRPHYVIRTSVNSSRVSLSRVSRDLYTALSLAEVFGDSNYTALSLAELVGDVMRAVQTIRNYIISIISIKNAK